MPLKTDKLNDALMTRLTIDALGRQKDRFNLAAARPADVKIEPVRLHYPDWNAKDAAAFLSSTELAGWRCVVTAKKPGTTADMTGFVDISTRDGRPAFAGLTHKGMFSDRLNGAIAFAKKWAGTQPEEYELRILDMPQVKMKALWLAGPKDVFIPCWEIGADANAPFAIEAGYIDRVLQKKAYSDAHYADMMKNRGPNDPPLGG